MADPRTTVEVELGELLLQGSGDVEDPVKDSVEADIRRVLEMRHHPDALALAALTDRLLTHCITLAAGVEEIPPAERSVRGAAVLETWTQLLADGPEDGPLGPWSYARHLALAARDMLSALNDHQAADRGAGAPFVGRSGLPPLTPESP
ncbi:DUF6415 family natural product biosynthesis protein [Streptomyces sp. ISL-36]|uniref:DUF6415 family natural product biosynthesis protein n=1 Tax=Streptomyces sp. ISL-36 TaxID=2819182 RepID=UPI0020363D67|nr:DUF6415 family natural product biosynthesis protein [Streptomyces sp. ISL-36]